jgi:hypothetical protein
MSTGRCAPIAELSSSTWATRAPGPISGGPGGTGRVGGSGGIGDILDSLFGGARIAEGVGAGTADRLAASCGGASFSRGTKVQEGGPHVEEHILQQVSASGRDPEEITGLYT